MVSSSLAGIDFDCVRQALVKHRANVRAAAAELKVPSLELRKLTRSHPRLIEVALEEAQRLVDRAEERLWEALEGDHKDRALAAAMYILSHSAAARERGWSRHGDGLSDGVSSAAPPTVVIWAGGDMPCGYRPLAPNVPEAHVAVDPPEDRGRH